MMKIIIIVLFLNITGYDCELNIMADINANINKQNNIKALKMNENDYYKGNMKNITTKDYANDFFNFAGAAKKHNMPVEEYDVITEDGYILKLFHIPGNTNKVVLICHGFLLSSDHFIIRGNISLIYMLAVQHFDIWAMNFRGNRYSRRHITLDPDIDSEFWQYSMHEIGLYDYRAVIDFVLDKTGQKRLSVVGHSEGTSAFFILMSEIPEYNKKIKVFAGLAPVCYLRHGGPTLAALFSITPILSTAFKVLGIEEILGFHSFCKQMIEIICSQGIVGYELCFNLLGLLTGFNPQNIELEFSPTIWKYFPAGSNWKNFEHYGQIYSRNRFCKFDYGVNNLAIYGHVKPPNYNLNKVTANVALFAARSDLVFGVKDVDRLKRKLPNVVWYQVVSDYKFNHIDYIWGRNAHMVLYPYIINILDKYNV